MFGIRALRFLLGMQHALKADHWAAVSSVAARRSDVPIPSNMSDVGAGTSLS